MNPEMPSVESSDDAQWDAYVAELKQYLRDHATHREIDIETESESETYNESSDAAKALEEVERGDFEAANNFLDSEIKKLESRIQLAEKLRGKDSEAQIFLTQFQKQLEVVQKLKDGLERQ